MFQGSVVSIHIAPQKEEKMVAVNEVEQVLGVLGGRVPLSYGIS